MGDFTFDVHDPKEQQAIAEVLGALDDKIAANRKLVTTIDEFASAVYKQAATDEQPLTDLARFVNGRNFTKNATGDGRVVVRIAELNSGIGGSTVRNRVEDTADDNLARPGDILFAWSGSLTLHRWTRPEALINQHIFKVVPKTEVPYWLAYQAVATKLPEFKGIAADKATTMGHIQRRHLDTQTATPTADEVEALDPLMTSLWDRAVAADRESQTLAQLRDTLLPALMDGRIRVKDAQETVEEVL
jgi:type I restriction enzyme S subunit